MAVRKKRATKKAPAKKAPESNGEEKKTRAPRSDYGYRPGAKISIENADKNYRGMRSEMFEILLKSKGKTVEHFEDSCPEDASAKGWLRFFVTDGVASLSGGE